MSKTLRGRHFISTQEWSRQELELLLDTSLDLKRRFYRDEPHRLLRDNFPTELGAPQDAEVWFISESGMPVVMQGFAEKRRDDSYRARLFRLLRHAGFALLVLLLAILIPALAASVRAEKMQAMFEAAREEVSQELQLREELAQANALLESVNAELRSRPDYRAVLESLARVTPDTTYVNQLSMEASEISISGFGEDASIFMQLLTGQPWLRAVTAPSAFQRDPRSGRERFTIDAVITMSQEDRADGSEG